MPERIQRRRDKGWKKPEGVVYVGRPTVWGNRYTVSNYKTPGACRTHQEAVDGFRRMWSEPHQIAYIQEQLRGKDLMCWCKIGQPCHADVLLEIANRPEEPEIIEK